MAEFAEERVNVRDLSEGMYVARLDRPWLGTPFPAHGFHIRSRHEIRLLASYCLYVYIDVAKSRSPAQDHAPAPRPRSGRIVLNAERANYPPRPARDLSRELPVARGLHEDLIRVLEQVTARVAAGAPAGIAPVGKAARRMIRSVIRNPDAAMWAARMQDRDARACARRVRSSIWALVFGRHLGLDRDRLEHLALGVLLSEIGCARVPTGVLDGAATDPAAAELARTHVARGLEILRGLGVHDEVAAVLATHHERYDGSGYPDGLKGARIPLCGQIAGIAGVYDRLTAPRRQGEALTPDLAMARLHGMRDQAFGTELIEEFIQAIGIYPAGTLVQLSSGEIGVVTGQNAERRLRPRVLLIVDRARAPLARQREIDLLASVRDAAGQPVDIVRTLPAGSYDLRLPAQKKGAITRFLEYGRSWFRSRKKAGQPSLPRPRADKYP